MKSKIFTILTLCYSSVAWLAADCSSISSYYYCNSTLTLSGNVAQDPLYKNGNYVIVADKGHGLNGYSLTAVFNELNVTTAEAKGDALRLNNWNTNIVIGDNFYGYTTGISGDVVNIDTKGTNAMLVIGDNAQFYAYGLPNGGMGIRSNVASSNTTHKIFVGNNASIITTGNGNNGLDGTGYGVYAGMTSMFRGTISNGYATVSIGNKSSITTTGNNSHAVYANRGGNITLGSTNITTYGNRADALFAETGNTLFTSGGTYKYNGGNIKLLGDTSIKVSDSNGYAARAYGENSTITSVGSHVYNVIGNMKAEKGGLIDINMSDGSRFYGKTEFDFAKNGVINIAISGENSLWQLTDNSSLTTLALADGAKINLPKQSNKSLNIDHLSGEGIFYQELDIDNGVNNGALVVIEKSSDGKHKLIFNDSNISYSNAGLSNNETFLVLRQNTGGNYNADFIGTADIGGYTYVVKNGNSSLGQNELDRYLANTGIKNSQTLSAIGLTHMNYLLGHEDTSALMQRIGKIGTDRKTQEDVWIRGYFGRFDSFDDEIGIQNANYYGFAAGADRVYALNNADFYFGFAFGLSNADIEYQIGDGKNKDYNFGLYSVYKHENGFYVNSLIKYHYFKDSFDTITSNGYAVNGDGSAKGLAASIESGKRWNFGNSNFFIEPQLELTYFLQGSLKIDSTSVDIKINSFDSFLTRASAVIGYSADAFDVYLKSGYIKEWLGDVEYSLDGNRGGDFELNNDIFDNVIGISTSYDNHRFHIEGTYQFGDIFENKKLNLGYRYSF